MYGVRLVTIPQLFERTSLEKLRRVVISNCEKVGLILTERRRAKKVILTKAYDPGVLEELNSISQKRWRGSCLSETYLGAKIKLKWQCKKGHVFWSPPGAVRAGQWCPKCAGNKKLTLKILRKYAVQQKGRCLATYYQNSQAKVQWECKRKHLWMAVSSSVLQGHWCPECAGQKKYTVTDLRHLAEKEKGVCLSIKYKGAHRKVRWMCNKGHKWNATPHNIRSGSWCPKCSKHSRKYSIRDMRRLAKSKMGYCMSIKYKGMHSKLLWKCSKNHSWRAVPASIKSGTWCPKCSRKSK